MSRTFLVVDASYPINTRTQRFVDTLIEAFGEGCVKVVAWNRDNSPVKHSDFLLYSKNAAYGKRFDKLKGLWGFRSFLKKNIDDLNPDFIIASHWDCLYLASGIIDSRTKLIYENLDIPTGSKIVRGISKFLEWEGLKKTDVLILASRFYKKEYASFKGRGFIIENKMPKSTQVKFIPKTKTTSHLNVSFIGSVRYAQILKNAIDAVEGLSDVTFHIFGGGSQIKEIEEYTKGKNNIIIHGPYNYNDIGRIYEQTDLVWAVYPANDHNVKYAISNKYHECLHYGIPGLFAENTCLADMVASRGAGYAINCYSVSDIRETIMHIAQNPAQLQKVTNNLCKMRETETDNWEDEILPFIDYLKQI